MRSWKVKSEKKKEPDVNKNKNINVYFCVAYSRYFYTSIHRVINRLWKPFNLSWMRVRIYYHRFNNLSELLNGDIAVKIGRVILSKYLMDRECNSSIPYKDNIKCVYKDKCRSKCLIYEVKWSMCESDYIGNTQQKIKKEWTVIYLIFYVYSITDKNHIHFLPIFNRTLIVLHHVQIYVSIYNFR